MIRYNSFLEARHEYALSKYHEMAAALRAQGRDVINLTIGDPSDLSYEGAHQALIEAVQATRTSAYPPFRGTDGQRKAIVAWAWRNYGIKIDPAQHVLSANGSKEAVFHLALLFDWSDGACIVAPSLSYPVYASSARMLGVPYVELSVSAASGFLPDLEAVPEQIWQRCRLFWLNSPHNPTSAIASHDYLARLLELARKYDFVVASDECYNEINFTGAAVASVLHFPESRHWICLRSLSKRSHMTGYRAGAMISLNTDIMERLARMRSPIGVGTPSFIQAAATAAWDDDEHPRRFCAQYRAKRDILLEAMRERGFEVFGAEASFYLWFRHSAMADSESLFKAFLEAGLLITPGTAFGPDGQGYCRMVYCETMERCEEIARRIRNVETPHA